MACSFIHKKGWFSDFRGKNVVLYTDNMQVMYMIKNQKSINSVCMSWLKEIFWISLIYNFKIIPEYINTKDNILADTLSRVGSKISESVVKHVNDMNMCCHEALSSIL